VTDKIDHEVDASCAAYDEHPANEPDEWGDLASWRRAAPANMDPEEIGDPDDLAAGALPASHPFDAVIGPFYDTTGLTKWLGVSRQALHQRVKVGSILGCPLDDGAIVYPAWQFVDNDATAPGLADLRLHRLQPRGRR
jgi:hypothetical protein